MITMFTDALINLLVDVVMSFFGSADSTSFLPPRHTCQQVVLIGTLCGCFMVRVGLPQLELMSADGMDM